MGKNIVLLTMALDIGGAETHIIELAMALKEKGHSVTVFSNGGAYVKVLEEHGIRHTWAPMNNKKLSSLVKSRKILKRFCKENHVSVIHSHTRITNFIANGICKKFYIPMVTTVHFNFKIGVFTKMFSFWGTRALSVSEDLKEYVSQGYGFNRNKVRVTVNGINLKTFSKGTNPELRKSFGLDETHKIVLCVSRIDTGACENVFRFLESAEEIYHNAPETRIVIVGNGNRFEELKRIAETLNQKTTENFVQLAGAQTNIADYCHMADVFAGVSRSALEAMACRLPTLLIGNCGYLGVYSEKIHQACIDTNFTCRGYEYIDPHEVAEIVTDMIRHPEHFAESVETAHKLIEKRYSVVAMAEDALASYEEASEDTFDYDLMISGYYGTHNFGDEVTLKTIIHNIRAQYPLKKIIILNHTNENEFNDDNIIVFHRFDLLNILPAMKRTRMFMLGGGSLLQDVTSNRSIFFYLFMLYHAQKYGCQVMIYGNGIGPIQKKRHEHFLLKILKKVDAITLRDENSYRYLEKHDLHNIQLTADETYNYNIPSCMPSMPDIASDQKTLLVNLRMYNQSSNNITDVVAEVLNDVCVKEGLYPVLMPVQFAQDYQPLSKLSEKLTVPHYLYKVRISNENIITLIKGCRYIITERLHPVIFAARLKKPFISVIYDPKVIATAKQLDMEAYALPLNGLKSGDLRKALLSLMDNEDSIRESLAKRSDLLHEAAKNNSEIAVKLLER